MWSLNVQIPSFKSSIVNKFTVKGLPIRGDPINIKSAIKLAWSKFIVVETTPWPAKY